MTLLENQIASLTEQYGWYGVINTVRQSLEQEYKNTAGPAADKIDAVICHLLESETILLSLRK